MRLREGRQPIRYPRAETRTQALWDVSPWKELSTSVSWNILKIAGSVRSRPVDATDRQVFKGKIRKSGIW